MGDERSFYVEILDFWRGAGPKAWFKADEDFDAVIRHRFETAHLLASRSAYPGWSATPEGALALVLLLDQFPRSLYRGSPHAFATDGLARAIAARAIEVGLDQAIELPLRIFFYMPFEHSEDAADQARSVSLMSAAGIDDYIRYARLHADIIARFGRFPHRNKALGRVSSAAELLYLAEGGFKG